MACVTPVTRSPGRLVLHYYNTVSGVKHTIGWHFITGVDLSDLTNLRIEAQRLATALAGAMTNRGIFDQWSIQNPDYSTYYAEPLPSPTPGIHTLLAQDYWESQTLCFEGTGQPPLPASCKGRSISRLHCFGAIRMTPTLRLFDSTPDADIRNAVAALNISTYLPADFYGQQAIINGFLPVQWNAHTQRVEGS